MPESGETFDYIIVGAGSAGCVLANRLTENPDFRVLLLEAGGWDYNPLIQIPLGWGLIFAHGMHDWHYQTEPEPQLGGRALEFARGKVIGGSSSINVLAYVRGNRLDYDRWASLWVRLLQVPYNLLYPIILALICIGIYTVNYNLFDILVVLVVGMAGYILRILDFEVAPLIIAFILGPLIEQNLRRATLLSRGDVAEAFLSPLSLGIYAATLAFVLWSYFAYRARQSTEAEPAK